MPLAAGKKQKSRANLLEAKALLPRTASANGTNERGRTTGRESNSLGVRDANGTTFAMETLGTGGRTRFPSYDATTSQYHAKRVTNANKFRLQDWEQHAWGSHVHADVSSEIIEASRRRVNDGTTKEPLLGEWPATAISGNDMLSSVLYATGMVTSSAGPLAPLCMVCVSLVLYMFRGIYAESITALPMNGGSYSLLLNATSKSKAAVAASITLMSFITTGMVSAIAAMLYLEQSFDFVEPVSHAIALLFLVGCLSLLGITASSRVAVCIFVGHIITLCLLILSAAWFTYENPHVIRNNLTLDLNLRGPHHKDYGKLVLDSRGSILIALFYGVSTAVLGYESSAQFVQQQAEGVFVKTLQNCWASFSVFNVSICMLAFAVLPMDDIVVNQATVLSAMATTIGHNFQHKYFPGTGDEFSLGSIFRLVICLDAFVVLSGAILSAFVGTTGLLRSMAKDRCLPQVLLLQSNLGTEWVIIVLFFLLCSSQVYLFYRDLSLMSDVFTFASLGVLVTLAFGCLLLKAKRPNLPRPHPVHIGTVVLAICVCVAAVVANVVGKPVSFSYFLLYLFAVATILFVMFMRVNLLRALEKRFEGRAFLDGMREKVRQALDCPVVFLVKHADAYQTNKAILYIRENEQTKQIILAHFMLSSRDVEAATVKGMSDLCDKFNGIYPRYGISLLTVKSDERTLSPALIEWLSTELNVPKNLIFMGSIDASFPHKIEELGGVRVVMNS